MRKIRWDCDNKGCFRNLCPRLGEFDECFPRGMGMSDIDGAFERNGRFLFMEWKSNGAALTTGQRIMFENLTSLSTDPASVIVMLVAGDPKTMEVDTLQVFHSGKGQEVQAIDTDGLKERIRAWYDRAENHKKSGAR